MSDIKGPVSISGKIECIGKVYIFLDNKLLVFSLNFALTLNDAGFLVS